MAKRGRDSSMRVQEEYATTDPDAWVGFGSGLGSAGAAMAAAAAAAAGGSGAAALPAAAKDSDLEAADETEPDSEGFNSSEEEEEVKPARKKAARGSGAAPKAAPKARKQAKAKEKKGPRIGAKKAMKIYHLDESDLAKMKDIKHNCNNFAFGYVATYSSKELEDYARAKHAGSAWFENSLQSHKAEQESQKERRRGYRATATTAALQRVEQYVAPPKAIEVEQYGETKLPDSVLIKVMVCLAKTREPGGLRGFACVAKDLANASLANWDFYRAAKEGWALLGEDAKTTPYPPVGRGPPVDRIDWYFSWKYGTSLQGLPGPSSLGGWAWWQGFLRDPLSPKATELKEALKTVGISPKGGKAEMAVQLLRAFGLDTATTVPVQLLRAVKLERFKRLAWDGPRGFWLHDRVNRAIEQMIAADAATWGHLQATREGAGRGVAYIRPVIRERFGSIDEFVEAAAAADQERQRREEQSRAAAAAAGEAPAAAAPAPAPAAGAGAPAAPFGGLLGRAFNTTVAARGAARTSDLLLFLGGFGGGSGYGYDDYDDDW